MKRLSTKSSSLVFMPTRPRPPRRLRAVRRDWRALDVAGVRDGDDDVLVGDGVLEGDLVGRGDYLRSARIAVLVANLPELVSHDEVDAVCRGEDLAQVA